MEDLRKPNRRTQKKHTSKTPIKDRRDLVKGLQEAYSRRDEGDEETSVDDNGLSVIVLPPKTKIIQTLETCIEWLNASEDALEEAAVRMIDERLQSHVKKSQVFLVVAIQKRMESLVRIMEAVDLIEKRLLDPEIIASMDVDDLRKTMELLEKKSQSIIEQVMLLIEEGGGMPRKLHDDDRIPILKQNGQKVLEDPRKREQVRSRLDSLLKKVRDGE